MTQKRQKTNIKTDRMANIIETERQTDKKTRRQEDKKTDSVTNG